MSKSNKKEKIFEVRVYWQGMGWVRIPAKNKEEAEEKYNHGEFNHEDFVDDSEGWEIESVEEVQNERE